MSEIDWRVGAIAEYKSRRQGAIARRSEYVRKLEEAKALIAQADEEISELDRAARAFGLLGAILEQADPSELVGSGVKEEPSRAGPLFKDVALQILKSAYPKAIRAAELQEQIEQRLSRKFHAKTAGMTLYRLAKDGTAERDGWDWYYKPSEEEKQELSIERHG
jgi:hypothetical protein